MPDLADADRWIRHYVAPVGPLEITHARPWSTVARVPVADGYVWFKACNPVQAFEPRLSAQLFARWPDRVAEVLAYDEDRAWLLLADAGTPVSGCGNPPQAWLTALPLYADLQRGESDHADDHVSHGVPDLRLARLPDAYAHLVERELPLDLDEVDRMRRFGTGFERLCRELGGYGIPESVQHDDLHMDNLYARAGQLRVLDWGDASIGHPFASLVETFRFLEQFNKLDPSDAWFGRLRDSYLEPWGRELRDAFALAIKVGGFAHCIAWQRQREFLPAHARPGFHQAFRIVLRRALMYASP